MVEEVILSSKELNIVLNVLTDKSSYVSIYSPLLRVELLSFDFYNLNEFELIDEPTFTSMVNEYKDKLMRVEKRLRSRLLNEVPNYSHLRDALHISGALPFKRVSELISDLNDLLASPPSIEKPKLTVLALDTNTFYLRLPTNYLLKLKIKPTLVISTAVCSEISSNLSESLRNKELLSRLRSLFSHLTRPDEVFFLGVESFKARRALLAFSELFKVKNEFEYHLIETEGFGDEAIVNSYKSFELKSKNRVVFITLDERARALAASPHILLESKYVEQVSVKEMASRVKLTYESLPKLLHTLATYFMLIRVSCGAHQVLIKGVWRWKRTEDWLIENVRVKSRGTVMKRVVRDLRRLREVERVLRKARTYRI